MHIFYRNLLVFVLLSIGLSAVIAESVSEDSGRSEIQLEFGKLLLDDGRPWEALIAYDLAKAGAKHDQLVRASSGMIYALQSVAEFNRAHQEALFLGSLRPDNPDVQTLIADAHWSAGLFEEAEQIYTSIIDSYPNNSAARHGIARSFLGRNQLDAALREIKIALADADVDPDVYHTLGSIFRRKNQYDEAADAYEDYVNRLPSVNRERRGQWVYSQIEFLRSFGNRVPLQIVSDDNRVHTIPFRLVNDKVIVRGKINSESPIDIVIDTGAEQMVLSQETAENVGVETITTTISAGVGDVGVRGLDLGRVDLLEIGSLVVRNVPTLIKNPPLSDLPRRRVLDSISPIALGLSTIIDYKNYQIQIADDLPDEPSDIDIPMRINRLAVIRGLINEHYPRTFVVDTGGEVISLSIGTTHSIGLSPPRHIPLRVYGTSGWDQDAFLLPGVQLDFNKVNYSNFTAVVLNLHRPSALLGFHIGGIVGHTFLSDYRVTFDLNRALLRLSS